MRLEELLLGEPLLPSVLLATGTLRQLPMLVLLGDAAAICRGEFPPPKSGMSPELGKLSDPKRKKVNTPHRLHPDGGLQLMLKRCLGSSLRYHGFYLVLVGCSGLF